MFSLPSLSDAPRNAETESRRLAIARVFYTLTDIQEVNFGPILIAYSTSAPRVVGWGDASMLKTREDSGRDLVFFFLHVASAEMQARE